MAHLLDKEFPFGDVKMPLSLPKILSAAETLTILASGLGVPSVPALDWLGRARPSNAGGQIERVAGVRADQIVLSLPRSDFGMYPGGGFRCLLSSSCSATHSFCVISAGTTRQPASSLVACGW